MATATDHSLHLWTKSLLLRLRNVQSGGFQFHLYQTLAATKTPEAGKGQAAVLKQETLTSISYASSTVLIENLTRK